VLQAQRELLEAQAQLEQQVLELLVQLALMARLAQREALGLLVQLAQEQRVQRELLAQMEPRD
jgi:hypothetical protein